MNRNEPRSARTALWLLRRTYHGSDGEALAGDLLERLASENRSRGWLWWQVLLAIAAGLAAAARRHGPEFGFAAAVLAANVLLWGPVTGWARQLPWHQWPWPLSYIAFEAGPNLLPSVPAFLVLGAGLRAQGRLRWSSLVKTGFLAILFTWGAVVLRVAVLGPPEPDTYWPLALPFLTLLFAARLGCGAVASLRDAAPFPAIDAAFHENNHKG